MIHANLGMSGTAQYSLLNDEDLSDFSIIFISEPSRFREPSGKTAAVPIAHSYWKQLLPTTSRHGRCPVRSMLWIRQDTQARQIAVPSTDITAAAVTLRDRTIFVAAVYIAKKKESVDDLELTSALSRKSTTSARTPAGDAIPRLLLASTKMFFKLGAIS